MSSAQTASRKSAAYTQEQFNRISDALIGELRSGEHLTLSLTAEDSQFIRLNGAKVRQIGTVHDGSLKLTYVLARDADQTQQEFRSGEIAVSQTGQFEEDLKRARASLDQLRREVPAMPVDPFAVLPQNAGSSEQITEGKLLSPEESVQSLLPLLQGVDLAGLYSAGSQIRASANSAGQRHWFYTETFSIDYSLYTPSERAVKAVYAGREWNADELRVQLQDSSQKLAALERPARKIAPGTYRTFLGSSAVNELLGMFGWGFLSENSLRQGQSAARHLRDGTKSLSPLFTLTEDFRSGAAPRFNSEGEVAPEVLPLIERGKLAHTLVNTRTAKEYGIASNFANDYESPRAPVVAAGSLKMSEVPRQLGTGLYLSDLHYLNWSDQPEGRVTGMTRYACFWVENGELAAPIENLRFDDNLFRIFGSELEALTESRAVNPDVSSYEFRSLGAAQVPGILLSSFQYTL